MDIFKASELIDYTLKKKKPQRVFKNASLVMVQTEEIIRADLAINDGIIVGIGDYDGVENIDMGGRYIAPGFVDAHLHLESTLAYPSELIHHASVRGTTTFIVDPHEAANVSGMDGMKFMLDATRACRANVYFMLPSCVPCVSWEDNGGDFGLEEMKELCGEERILGLGEVMDLDSILEKRENMLGKLNYISSIRGSVMDGHAPFFDDLSLQAYSMFNIRTDHEATEYDYAMKERRNGITVHIREGSAARNLDAIVGGIVKNNTPIDGFCFCTDDKHIDDIKAQGHISYNIRRSIELGMSPIKAYKAASLNPSICYGLNHIGMIAPGRQADLVVLNDLENVKIEDVYYKGEELKDEFTAANASDINPKLLDTVNIDFFEKEMLKADDCEYAIELIDGQITTGKVRISDCDVEDLNKIVLIERHKGKKKYTVSYVKGYGIKNGAVATSVAHDSHNVIVCGDNDEDMMTALKAVAGHRGGFAVVSGGEAMSLPLPIMGLMSYEKSVLISERLSELIKRAYELGVNKGIDPFISLSFIGLPVIPHLRITAEGLYDVIEGKFVK